MRKESNISKRPAAPWRKHLGTLLTASALILARCIYRVVEYQQGKTGYLLSHEVFVYTLDGGLMLIVMLNFHFVHPSEIKALLHGGNMAVLFKIKSLPRPSNFQDGEAYNMADGQQLE